MTSNALVVLMLTSVCGLLACTGASHTPIGGETNWLSTCDSDADCGETACVCGLCSERCGAREDCPSGVMCQPATSELVTGACGTQPSDGLCAPACERDADCPGGQRCLQQACAPDVETAAEDPKAVETALPSVDCQTPQGEYEPAYTPVTTNCDAAPQAESVTFEADRLPRTAIVQRPTYSVTTETELFDCELRLRQDIKTADGRMTQSVESVQLLVANDLEIRGRVSATRYDADGAVECDGVYELSLSRTGTTVGAGDE